MGNIRVIIGKERLLTPSGLGIISEIFGKSGLLNFAAKQRTEKRSQPQIKNDDIFLTEIALLALGKTDFEDVNEFHTDDELYEKVIGIKHGIPSESTLRMRLDEIGQKCNKEILQMNVNLLKVCGVEPSVLPCGLVPVDIDVTPFDNSNSKKEGVSRTYKNFDGYAPIIAYIGEEGYMCNCELREGKQHCQKGTPEFLEETIYAAKKTTDKTLLIRMDSGNDALDNMALLHWADSKIKFLIKRNFRREDKLNTAEELKKVCKNIAKPRDGKTVYIGSTYREFFDKKIGNFTVRAVYEITERTTDADGQQFIEPETEINMYWTSLGCSDEDVIELYHNHAVCEQYHSELKSDMNVERFPSGKFDTNALVLKLAMIAFNILRIIGTQAMRGNDAPNPKKVRRRRLKTIIENLMLIASHFTVHARNYTLSLGKSSFWADTFIRIFNFFKMNTEVLID